jgi:hypothetical protein
MEEKILRIGKYVLFLGAVFFLILTAIPSSAITDSTGDVYHWKLTNNTWSWGEYTGQKDNIDITSIEYSIVGSEATLTMTIKGSIEESQNIFYYMRMVGTSGTYQAYYAMGTGLWSGLDGFSGEGGQLTDPISGNTFTATFTISDPSDSYEVYGWAVEYSNIQNTQTAEWWADYAPVDYAPWATTGDDDTGDDTGDDDTGDDDSGGEDTGDDDTGEDGTDGEDTADEGGDGDGGGTPGFELLAVIAALAIALIILRKRK